MKSKRIAAAALACLMLTGCRVTVRDVSSAQTETLREEAGTVRAVWEQTAADGNAAGMEIETADGNVWVVEGYSVSIGTAVTVTFNTAGTTAVDDDTIIAVTIM